MTVRLHEGNETMTPQHASRWRRRVAGWALIAAPLGFFAGTLVHPGLRSDASEQIALVADHPDAWYATHALGYLAVILFIPAILGIGHLLRSCAPGWAFAGSALALSGLIGWGGIVVVFGFVAWQMGVGPDHAEMSNLFRRINETPEAMLPLRGLAFLFAAGMICFAIGLLRSRVVPRWAPPLIAAGFVQFAVAGMASEAVILIPATALMSIGLGAVGLEILRTSDREWACLG